MAIENEFSEMELGIEGRLRQKKDVNKNVDKCPHLPIGKSYLIL